MSKTSYIWYFLHLASSAASPIAFCRPV